MATCVPAPACVAVRRQATRLWPDRSQASDGICASSQHHQQNPGSDHEPHVIFKGVAYATAVDLTDDKAHGCDADAWADWLVATRDPRVKYIIRNKEMASSYPVRAFPAWTWRLYEGPNPHLSHTHLSVKPEAIFDDGPWFPQLAKTPAPPSVIDLEESLLMPLGKTMEDDRRAWVRLQCLTFWGREPSAADLDFLTKEVGLKGTDNVLAQVADHSYAQAFRAKRGW